MIRMWWKDSSYDTWCGGRTALMIRMWYVCGGRTALMIRMWWKLL